MASGESQSDREKAAAGEAAAELVEAGMRVGLGTGSTVERFLPALARRAPRDIRCVATSAATEAQAAALGLPVEPFETLERLDIAIDGADEVDPDGWLIKGGGGALLREKVVAAAAERFVVLVSAEKLVPRLRRALPLELLAFGLAATLAELGSATLRAGAPPSPDGGRIADLAVPLDDPAALARRLDAIPGVVGHGLFPPAMVAELFVAGRRVAPAELPDLIAAAG
ncbi:MAG TPA: ribose 5-phosphate isomerase A [Solirubrobacteraceae bacterium]|jgi:ribose 5-phosphate isomerase A